MLIVPLVVGQPIGSVSNSANQTVLMCKLSSFHPYLTQALRIVYKDTIGGAHSAVST